MWNVCNISIYGTSHYAPFLCVFVSLHTVRSCSNVVPAGGVGRAAHFEELFPFLLLDSFGEVTRPWLVVLLLRGGIYFLRRASVDELTVFVCVQT